MDASTGGGMDLWDPPVDIFQKGENLHLRIDLPGVERKDVSLAIRGGGLVIRGQKRSNRYPLTGPICFHCMEITHGRFEKVIHLAHTVDIRNSTARMKDGVLFLKLPIIRDRRGTDIEIQVDSE